MSTNIQPDSESLVSDELLELSELDSLRDELLAITPPGRDWPVTGPVVPLSFP
jgi:hypothetical protein